MRITIIYRFVGLILLALSQAAFAQSELQTNDLLRRATEHCQKSAIDPFKPTGEIRNEIACVAAAIEMLSNNTPSIDDPAIELTARIGTWDYEYVLSGVSSEKTFCKVEGVIVLPTGRPVQIRLSSEDTIHELQIPALGLKATGIPGRIETLVLQQDAAAEIDAIAITNVGSSNVKQVQVKLRFVKEVEYEKWERDVLHARGC